MTLNQKQFDAIAALKITAKSIPKIPLVNDVI
jgi:hypothetical protein